MNNETLKILDTKIAAMIKRINNELPVLDNRHCMYITTKIAIHYLVNNAKLNLNIEQRQTYVNQVFEDINNQIKK